MDILIIAGFLGSGKTSLIKPMIRGLVDSGQTCAIIENEIGEISIDDATLGQADLQVTTLFGGCVCCQISGSLVTAVEKIQDEINPDWVIVEMTGLALLDGIRDLFSEYGRPNIYIHTISIVDMSRWKHLVGVLSRVFDPQVEGADLVLMNKIDVQQPNEETFSILREKAPNAKQIVLDDASKEPEIIWGLISEAFGITR